MASLQGRSLLSLHDLSVEELMGVLETAKALKKERRNGIRLQRFAGYSLAIVFEKLSTRTRSAFETAFGEEGGHPVFLSSKDIHLGVKESVEDTARVFGRMFDAIAFRGYKQATVEVLAKYSGVPVVNGLTDMYHPTQVLADLLTLLENFTSLKGLHLAYVGDGRNNVAHSLLIGAAKLGIHFTCVSPDSLAPPQQWLSSTSELAKTSGSRIRIDNSIDSLRGADAVYTDVWVSMGEESAQTERERLLRPYQVNADTMAATGNPGAIFLHCLPAVKGKEVSADIIEGPQSRVWDQAENRKHTIKSVLLHCLGLAGA